MYPCDLVATIDGTIHNLTRVCATIGARQRGWCGRTTYFLSATNEVIERHEEWTRDQDVRITLAVLPDVPATVAGVFNANLVALVRSTQRAAHAA